MKTFAIIDNSQKTTDTVTTKLPNLKFLVWSPQALEEKRSTPDLILLSAESQPGNEPSLRLLKRLTSNPKLEHIPKVIIEDSLSPNEKVKFFQHGAHQFMSSLVNEDYHSLFLTRTAENYSKTKQFQNQIAKFVVVILENEQSVVRQYQSCLVGHTILHIKCFDEIPKHLHINLFIIDIYLGRGNENGFKFIERLNQSEFYNIPFVVSSSAFRVQDKIRSLELGSLEFLDKPIVNRILKIRLFSSICG